MRCRGALSADGRTLSVSRTLEAPLADVWAGVTESDRLARWFGRWTGDPGEGFVMVTMTAEATPLPPIRSQIDACEPPHRLAVRSSGQYGDWSLSVDLAEADGVTSLVLHQHDVDLATLAEMGPGWEWYLDRLVAAVTGGEPPAPGDFDSYMVLAPNYAALADTVT